MRDEVNSSDEPFELHVWDGSELLDHQMLADPFIHTTVGVKRGPRAAWRVLWHGVEFVVHVSPTPRPRTDPAPRGTEATKAAIRRERGGMDAPTPPEGYA